MKLRASTLVFLFGVGTAGAVFAQGSSMPSAFQGFSRDRDDPVKIEANSLEIIDKDRYAVFSGNVTVQQGDSMMRSRELKVYYEGSLRDQKGAKDKDAKEPAAAAKSAPVAKNDPAQRIRRIEALGGIVVSSKDQKATGDTGIFDMPTNTATITGNVVISQGPNIMRGDKLVVDLKTGYARMESGSKGGTSRVQGLFLPSSIDDKKKPGAQK
jgi:lipopolysaccharide export system protein LptA